jgi:nitrogenase iron protein NifH
MRKIAVYGKGGIGKSTITSSLAAAMASMGYRVIQIGCDPKADSTINLTGGKEASPIIQYLKLHGECDAIDEIATVGFKDILCFEAGGPPPGMGCAGRGIVTAFELLDELNVFDTYNPDFVFYDVLGDVVCGGFAMPIRNGYADEVIIVSSGEKMALYAAQNIKWAIDTFSVRNNVSLLGIILNKRNIVDEEEILEEFVGMNETKLLGIIPRDPHVQAYENKNMTVIEGDPNLEVSKKIFEIARSIIKMEVKSDDTNKKTFVFDTCDPSA